MLKSLPSLTCYCQKIPEEFNLKLQPSNLSSQIFITRSNQGHEVSHICQNKISK